MAKSFFERLTGSIRVREQDEEESGANGVETKAVPPPPAKSRRKNERREESGKIIHPVGVGETDQSPETAEEDEEGELTVDIYDDGSHIVIQSTVAGVKPEDIDISLQEETLTVRGSRKRMHEVKDASFYYRELYWGSFSRSIILPEEVDFQKAEASIKNGLLTVRLPKKDKGEKKIRVKVE